MPEGPEEVLETIGKVVKGKTKEGRGQSVFFLRDGKAPTSLFPNRV
jgi:hypothetical protein